MLQAKPSTTVKSNKSNTNESKSSDKVGDCFADRNFHIDYQLESPHENLQNMSPGFSFFVLTIAKDENKNDVREVSDVIDVQIEQKVWGLITRPGSINNPLPEGPSKHFAALMFNARSEDAAEKPSFGRLIRQSQSCIVPLPVDGFKS